MQCQVEGSSTLAVQMKRCAEEDVKVRIADGRIAEIGKALSPGVSAGESIGVGRIGPGEAGPMLEATERFMEEGRFDLTPPHAVQAIIDLGHEVLALDTGDRRAIEIDFAEDYERAGEMFG